MRVSHGASETTSRTHPLSNSSATLSRLSSARRHRVVTAPACAHRPLVPRASGTRGRARPRRLTREEFAAHTSIARGGTGGLRRATSDYIFLPGATPRDAMASSELTPSKSTQDLIQASRPGFPKGLRVRRRRPARIPLGRGGDAERDTDLFGPLPIDVDDALSLCAQTIENSRRGAAARRAHPGPPV